MEIKDEKMEKLAKTAENLFFLLIGGILGVFLQLFFILSIPVYIFRFVLSIFAKRFRSDLGDMLNGQSSMFVNELFGSNRLRGNIIVCVTLGGKFTPEEVDDMVRKHWIEATDPKTGRLVYERFQQYAVKWCGFAFYKKAYDTFDIRNHVHFHESFGAPVVSEEDVIDFTETLMNGGYRPKTSPWEVHLVHNYKNPKLSQNEMSLLIFKFHHSLADGYSILSAIMDGIIQHPLSTLKMPVPRMPKRSPLEQIIYWITFPLLSLYELAVFVGESLRASPWKVPDGRKEWYQFCAKSDPILIEKVVKIKNTFGVTFTSVLVSAISSAISQSFEARNNKGEKLEGDNGSLYCLSALPLPNHNRMLTNHATAGLFSIPTIKCSDSLERLQNCNAILERSRSSVIPYITKFVCSMMGCHFTSVCGRLFKNRAVSTGLTNFPSLPIVIEKNGKFGIISDFVVGAMEGNAGVGIMTLSYDNYIRVCVSAEKALMSKEETKTFVENISDEINLLYDEAVRTSSFNGILSGNIIRG